MKKNKTFTRPIQIRFHEADPAGIVYFANVFSIAHDTFEEFIEVAGVPWGEWFRKGPYFVPIRHAECDYLAPFRPGQKYRVQTEVARIGETSFQMKYTFQSGPKKKPQTHAIVTMVHAFVSAKTKKKIKVPARYQKALKPYAQD